MFSLDWVHILVVLWNELWAFTTHTLKPFIHGVKVFEDRVLWVAGFEQVVKAELSDRFSASEEI